MAKRKPDQLDIDSSAAIKAGMSYGKYMATKTPAKVAPKPEEPNEYRRVCPHCGEIFYRYDQKAQKYCSARCKKDAENARARQRARQRGDTEQIIKSCAICGKEFVAASYRNKYCSQLCVSMAQSRRVLEWRRKHKKEVGKDELEI